MSHRKGMRPVMISQRAVTFANSQGETNKGVQIKPNTKPEKKGTNKTTKSVYCNLQFHRKGGGGGGGVLLGILGRGVPPSTPNPDPISDQNIPFSTPAAHQSRSQEFVNFIRKFRSGAIFWILLFLYYLFGVEKTKTLIRSRDSLENNTRFKTIMVKIHTRFQAKTAQKP